MLTALIPFPAGYVATGVGVVVGNHARLGGWALDAAMAESPAEEAGLRRGERILAVGAES